jgi:thiosulfate dehydrogenase [quinone] large subunit
MKTAEYVAGTDGHVVVADAAPSTRTVPTVEAKAVRGGRIWGVLRIAMGWTFLWAFLDKAFALGFSTGRLEDGTIDFFAKGGAWFNGGSPTEGVLAFALKGPFKGLYETLGGVEVGAQGPVATGSGWIDVVYMASVLLIGLGLIFGIGTRLAAIGGIAWMAIFYTATAIWPEHNAFLDDHVVYAIVLAGIAYVGAGRYLGLGRRWENTRIVKRYPVLG